MVAADLPTCDGLRQIHYVILLPPLGVCLERVQLRVDHGFSDRSVASNLYEQFAKTVVDTRYLITEPGDHPAGLAELMTRRLDDGQFRYSAF